MKILKLILLCMLYACFAFSQDKSIITQQLSNELQSLADKNHLVGFSNAIYNEEGALSKMPMATLIWKLKRNIH